MLLALLALSAVEGVLLLTPDDLTAKDLEGTWKGERFTEGSGDGKGGEKVEFTFKGNALVGGKDMKRPGSFTANPGSAHYLIVLTKAK
jgi:hypothetical protein